MSDNKGQGGLEFLLDQNAKEINEFTQFCKEKNCRVSELNDRFDKSFENDEKKTIYDEFDKLCPEFIERCRACFNRVVRESPLLTAVDISAEVKASVLNDNKKKVKELHQGFIENYKRVGDAMRATSKRLVTLCVGDRIPEDVIDKMDCQQMDRVREEFMVSGDLVDALGAIEDRNVEVLKLEREIRELYELFKDLAVLVDIGQDSVDEVKGHVDNAKVKVEKGAEHIKKAEEHQNSARKRMCCVFAILMAVLVVILVPILFTQLKTS